jgi:MoaA/NifB/PqqE/SkfB family radical SAM enzyme
MSLKNYWAATWVLANPSIVYRVVRGFARAMFGKNTLKIIELFPTFACPSACPICSIEKYQKKKGPVLQIDDYVKLADEGAKLGAIAVTILGGEPFVYKQLPELVRIFKRKGFFCNIVTGGSGVTRKSLESLKEAGIGSIHFSLESLDKEINDPLRGKGHVNNTMQNIQWCRELGIAAGLAPVFTPDGMQEAELVVRYGHENNLKIAASQVAATGLAEKSALLSSEQHGRIRQLLGVYPGLTLDWTMSYFFRHQCPAGKEKIGITAHGDVIGCSINNISFGNVRDEKLSTIWRRMGRFSQFKANAPVCLSAESQDYIDNYLKPVHDANEYPLSYLQHPLMGPDKEPDLYKD